MRVCLICEGSYPYVSGGVSNWVQMLCNEFKDIEFVIWSIATTREDMSEYKYELPSNIKMVRTIYLGDDKFGQVYKKVKLTKEEYEILRKLILSDEREIDWQKTLEFIKKQKEHMVDILMSEAFYDICLEEYRKSNCIETFQQYLWSFRSMYFPFMDVLKGDIVKADVYHAISTGYAGILGSAASYIENKPLLLSEHGVYTREREEDIIRADWVKGGFKELWISFFKKISAITYQQAQIVTTLFEVNKTLQLELGCPEGKIKIIPNGISIENFRNLNSKNKLSKNKFNIAAVLRVVPIKDVKTMILAFHLVQEKYPEVRLSLLGNYDENPEYYYECIELIKSLDIKGIEFLGQVNILEYMSEIDLLLLSSISEGQPFAVLEGMAAGIPFVCTNVGDCKELLEGGNNDTLGNAGIIVPVMNSKAMADAIIYLIKHPNELKKMGEVGQKRVEEFYRKENFLSQYHEIYKKFLGGN